MKKFYTLVLFLISIISQSQIISFPDANFKAKLLESSFSNYIAYDIDGISMQIDANADGEVDMDEALAVGYLNIFNSNISSMSGLENFHNLIRLACSGLLITNLCLFGTQVNHLTCENMLNLISINLKNNVQSTYMYPDPIVPPFFVSNLPSLQNVCCDISELQEVQSFFNEFTSNIITDCDYSCSFLSNINLQLNIFSISPNPTSSILNINANSSEIKEISIYNLLGQVIKINDSNLKTIDVSDLNAGTYFISIKTTTSIETQKFIKI